MEIKLEAALGHLWFEEAMTHDPNVMPAKVWTHFERSLWFARAMLDGGENQEGVFRALSDPQIRQELEEVVASLHEFRALANQRLASLDAGGAGIGSDIDERFDALFERFMLQADEVETRLQELLAEELQHFQESQDRGLP